MDFKLKMEKIQEYVSNEEYFEAIRELLALLANKDCPKEAYQWYVLSLRMLGEHSSAEIVEQVLIEPYQILTHFQLGLFFMRERIYECAIKQLLQCVQECPDDALYRLNLGITLLKLSSPHEAVRELEISFGLQPSQMTAYYMSFALLLSGQAEEARKYALQTDEIHRVTILDMIHRYELYSLPTNIRDWTFVKSGTALLRTELETESEFGNNTQHGIYTLIPFTEKRLIETLAALQSLLGIFRGVFGEYNQIAYLGERSRYVAEIYAQMRHLPVKETTEELILSGETLFIAADTDEVERYRENFLQSNKSLLFTLVHDWTRDGSINPDIVGYMSQYSCLPWEPVISINEDHELITTSSKGSSKDLNENKIMECLENINLEFIEKLINYYQNREEDLSVGIQKLDKRDLYQRQYVISGTRYF